jgi:hypothetical protein
MNKKLIISLFLMVFLLGVGIWAVQNRTFFAPRASLDKVDISLVSSATTFRTGQKFVVDVFATPHTLHISAVELAISFSNVKLNSITPTSSLSQVLQPEILSPSPARVIWGATCSTTGCQTVSTPTKIAQLEFEGVAAGNATIAIDPLTKVAVTEDQTETSALGDRGNLALNMSTVATFYQLLQNWLTATHDQNTDTKVNSIDFVIINP